MVVWNVLNRGESRLAAAAPFYGPAPASPDFSPSRAAVLAVYAERDARVNATREAARSALEKAGLPHELPAGHLTGAQEPRRLGGVVNGSTGTTPTCPGERRRNRQ
jgi:dienelactone hydrolase